MKKYKIIAYICIILFLILATSFGTYKVISSNQNKEKEIQEKAKSEVKYLEQNLVKMFNQMNNIEYENYKITISEISPESSNQKSNEESQNSQSSEKGKSDSGGSESSSGSETNSQSESEGSESSSDSTSGSGGVKSSGNASGSNTQTYNLEQTGVLTTTEQIDWKKIKNEIENIYLSIPTITLDLYQTQADEQDILSLNSEYDNLTKIIQEENKSNTLNQLVTIYDILVKIADKSLESETEKTVLRTKAHIFKAYSNLEGENWEEISKNTSSAIEEFTKLMTQKDTEEEKQYSINKTYIMISELQKSVEKQDSGIFLIKYKNTLEELSTI